MNREEFEKLILRNKDGNFYPSFTIEDGEYFLTGDYTAEEAYGRWLKSKEIEVDKTKICLTQEQRVIQDLSIELAKLKLQLLNK